MCSFQGVVMNLTGALLVGCLFGQSKRLQSLRLFTNLSDVGLIFHHSLFALFGTLFLSETCFGAGSSLIRFGCQCHLPFGDQPTFAAMAQLIHRSSSSWLLSSMFILENLNRPDSQVTLTKVKNALAHPSIAEAWPRTTV